MFNFMFPKITSRYDFNFYDKLKKKYMVLYSKMLIAIFRILIKIITIFKAMKAMIS